MNFDRPYNPAEHGTYSEWQKATAPELEKLAQRPEAPEESATEQEESFQAWHDHLADMADEAAFESCGE